MHELYANTNTGSTKVQQEETARAETEPGIVSVGSQSHVESIGACIALALLCTIDLWYLM